MSSGLLRWMGRVIASNTETLTPSHCLGLPYPTPFVDMEARLKKYCLGIKDHMTLCTECISYIELDLFEGRITVLTSHK